MIRVSSMYDNSGYGVAGMNTAMLLLKHGFDISTNVIYTPMSRRDFARSKELAEINKRVSQVRADINLAITVPFLCDKHFQKNSYCILSMFWETDRICQDWVDTINKGLTNEVWVPCQSNYDALINSGVKKPVYIIPQYMNKTLMSREDAYNILPIPQKTENTYNFYSIFQWTERKNPIALLQAYYNEFTADDNVMLTLKTYGPSPFTDKRSIKEVILSLKESSGNKNPPPVFYLGDLLQPEQVDAIAPQGDCYVYCGRGEGWNIPLVDAMRYRQQIITTKTGGIADWITNGYGEPTINVIPHTWMELDPNSQAWGIFYSSIPPQKWGDVKIEDVQLAMRKAYNGRGRHILSSADPFKRILDVCSEENVIKLMTNRLDDIMRKL